MYHPNVDLQRDLLELFTETLPCVRDEVCPNPAHTSLIHKAEVSLFHSRLNLKKSHDALGPLSCEWILRNELLYSVI